MEVTTNSGRELSISAKNLEAGTGEYIEWVFVCTNKDAVPILEAMKKIIAFYHNENFDILEIRSTLLNSVENCLQEFIGLKVNPFTFLFMRKAVVHKVFIPRLTFLYQPVVAIDASQLYPYSICQRLPTRLSTSGILMQRSADYNRDRTRPVALITSSSPVFITWHLLVKLKATKQADRKLTASVLLFFLSHCNTLFEAMGCFYQFCFCQEIRPSLNKEGVQRDFKKREIDELRRKKWKKKAYRQLRCGSVRSADCTKQTLREKNIYEWSFCTVFDLQNVNF